MISREERLLTVLQFPRVSEKAMRVVANERAQYVFEVAPEATKADIAAAVEYVFKVKVSAVNVCNQAGKRRVFRGQSGRRKAIRKAYVTLQAGQNIDLYGQP
jgi:large subunit ribosomal protein L23